MKEIKRSEIHLVLDASGSMWCRKDDTIGSLNQFMEDQKKVKGKCRVTVVQFNDSAFTVVDNVKLKNVPEFNGYNYSPTGVTALYDAIGMAASAIEKREVGDDTKVIMVIMTDGYENASKEYTYDNIRRILDAHPEWEVVFLGANIDSAHVSSSIGVAAHKTMDYVDNSEGLKAAYASMSVNTAQVRMGTKADMSIEERDLKAQKDAEDPK